jgi:hypothetical protein
MNELKQNNVTNSHAAYFKNESQYQYVLALGGTMMFSETETSISVCHL